MYPKPIEFYYAPTSVEEALRLLQQHRGTAKLIAGGQSLMPLLKLRFVELQCLIDLNKIAGLADVREESGFLHIGAMAHHSNLAQHPAIRHTYSLLADAAQGIGDPQVRNRGTIGGSLVHADPAADYPAAVMALDARVLLTRADGSRRTLAADELIVGPLTSAAEEDELVTEIQIAQPPPRSGGAYAKHSVVAGDYAVISVAAQITLDQNGQCQQAAIVVGGVMPKPARALRAAEMLPGTLLDKAVCNQAGEVAAAEVEVDTDTRASAEYRRSLIRTYVPAMILRAKERAGGVQA
jgi:aerobic carbon-monoxide dehydrogenase medium subunit